MGVTGTTLESTIAGAGYAPGSDAINIADLESIVHLRPRTTPTRSLLVLLDLMGGVALLLWGMHMVQSGILRAYGTDLRRVLGTGLRSRWQAFAAGLGVTALLQSSTATALMATSFVAGGMVDLSPALAIMLGANVGSTLIVQLLSFDIGWLSPLLLVAG